MTRVQRNSLNRSGLFLSVITVLATPGFPRPSPLSRGAGASASSARRSELSGAHFGVGYRLHHLSNAGRGPVNPGIDSHMFYIGLWIH